MLRNIQAALFAAVVLVGSTAGAFAEICGTGTTTSSSVRVDLPQVKMFFIMNRSANMICIAFDAAASMGGTNCGANSYALQPGSSTAAGGSFTMPAGFLPGSFNIISTAGGDAYSCTYRR